MKILQNISKARERAKRVMISSWIVTIACILVYLGIGLYVHDVLGYHSTDTLDWAPKWILVSVYSACTCGFIGIFIGAPVAIISTIIYFIQRKTLQKS